jgi:hypothetical protein
MKKGIVFLIIGLTSVLINCGSEKGTEAEDNFDRAALLTNWADNLIIPGYTDLVTTLESMQVSVEAFNSDPTISTLSDLRSEWLSAYLEWQRVAMYEIGKAEEITLRNYMNVYPLDAVSMEASILAGGYDLASVNRQDEQGFPALDFLLYGVASSDEGIVAVFTDQINGLKYRTYLSDVTDRMVTLVTSVLMDWNGGYRDTFISRNGSSSTESVNKLVNDFMLYYEKYFRAGKIGIPAGVFIGNTLKDNVEARYSGKSKLLFSAGLDAIQAFFNGQYSGGSINGVGLDDYLTELNALRQGTDLSAIINNQFELIRDLASSLDDDFGVQVETDNTLMLQTYDALQLNVINMKVDMFQSLNINVDYVDADGD